MSEHTAKEAQRTSVASSTRIAWLDSAEEPAKPLRPSIVRRAASIGGGLWVLARLLLVYLAVPTVLLVTFVALVAVFRLHPLIGGVIIAIGVGLGLSFYYDEIVR